MSTQFPSYNELRRAHRAPRLLIDAQRLFWTLDGPLANSMWIMKDANSPDSLEAYSQGAGWHPVSKSPLTEPKVSSITVHADELNMWEEQWLDFHRDHSDPDEYDKTMVQWGALPDYDPEEDEEGPEHLLVCCGTKRPRGKEASVEVRPAAASSFVTVHDYVSTVQPWLMGLRDDLLAAMGVYDDEPLPSETKLMVNYDAPDRLKMEEQATWIRLRRQKPSQQFLDAIVIRQGGAGMRG